MIDPEVLMFGPSDWVPNHPFLPVLAYRQVLTDNTDDRASEFERLFSEAGWKGLWRNGVYSYQHYHSGAHEVLAIAEGHAELLIGGPEGTRLDVSAGDCLVLPAGTGHMRLASSADFLVIGGYPPGQGADIQIKAATKAQLETIAGVPLPDGDPLYGSGGPLVALWGKAAGA